MCVWVARSHGRQPKQTPAQVMHWKFVFVEVLRSLFHQASVYIGATPDWENGTLVFCFFLTLPSQSSMWSLVVFRLIVMLDLSNAESLTTFSRKETPPRPPDTNTCTQIHTQTHAQIHTLAGPPYRLNLSSLSMKLMADGTKTLVRYASDRKSLRFYKPMSVSCLYTVFLSLTHTPCRKRTEHSITKRPKWLNFPRAPQRSHSPRQHRCPGPRTESISLLYFLLTDLSVDSLKRSPQKGP